MKKIKKSLNVDPLFLLNLAMESHMYFTELCFSHKIPAKLSPLLRLFFQGVDESSHLILACFHDSPFEIILLYSYVLWRILGSSDFKNCVVVCGNNKKAKEVYETFCNELLNNKNLKCFNHRIVKQNMNGWKIIFPNHHAKLSIVSYPKKPHTLGNGDAYPDLIIGVDLDGAPTDKKTLFNWVQEAFYDPKYLCENIFILGSVSQEDNLFVRLDDHQRNVAKKDRTNVFVVPLFSEKKQCYWKQRYNDDEVSEMLKNYDDPIWQLQNLCHIRENIDLPAEYFDSNDNLLSEKLIDHGKNTGVNINTIKYMVSSNNQPYCFGDISGDYHYGVGTVHTFIPEQKDDT